jgi:hypothetical protein
VNGSIVLTNWATATTISISTATTRPIPAHDGQAGAATDQGDFEVGEVCAWISQGKLIDYASNEGNPLEQQLWQVSFAASGSS